MIMQGRFWEEQFESLNIPAASKSKFQFEDGNPRVCLHPNLVQKLDFVLRKHFIHLLTTCVCKLTTRWTTEMSNQQSSTMSLWDPLDLALL